MNYQSDIQLGAEYRDRQTGVTGIAVVISFHQHSCERVVVETPVKDEGNEIKFYEFDSVRLEKVGQGFAKVSERPEPEHEPTRATGATQTAGVRSTGRRQS